MFCSVFLLDVLLDAFSIFLLDVCSMLFWSMFPFDDRPDLAARSWDWLSPMPFGLRTGIPQQSG
jgi:hypothetical protein